MRMAGLQAFTVAGIVVLVLGVGTLARAEDGGAKTPKAVTVQMETSDGRDGGKIVLVQEKHDVKVQAELKNLDPGVHAIHFHQNPKCDAPDFKTAGAHFNPGGKQHGLQNPQGHHAGDMPVNLNVGDDGSISKVFTTKDLTLDPKAPNSVFANGGTAIMIHAQADDMKSDPGGNAGAREACGIVNIANATDKAPGLNFGGKGTPSNR